MQNVLLRAGRLFVSALLIAGIFCALLSLRYGSLKAALAVLTGHPCILLSDLVDVGLIKANEEIKCQLSVQNLAKNPIRIVGIETSCPCVVTKVEIPFEIPSAGTATMPLELTIRNELPQFKYSVLIYCDLGSHLPAPLLGHITGKCESVSKRSSAFEISENQ